MSISGFTIVRNAEKLDYPFRESVLSLLPFCDELIINCGDSTDNTWEICRSLERDAPGKIKLIKSIWNKDEQSGGWQLKVQTDAALAQCRGDWCFYLQADEVLHEGDTPQIRKAMEQADLNPKIDGIVFDYLHFYGDYAYTIRGRNWYRREVRLFKNGRGISAFRDAQGFRKEPSERLQAIRSRARVFHYGYVRSAKSLGTKSEEMSQWWGEKPTTAPEALQLRRHVGLGRFTDSHPAPMRVRIKNYGYHFDPKSCERKWDKREIKNALTLAWESIFPFRIGEFRNYELVVSDGFVR